MWTSDKKKEQKTVTGRYTNIQRMCSHDGPGLRSTLFLKGCPLHCTWCHNPETISQHDDIAWNEVKCIGCQTCVQVCKTGAVQMLSDGLHIDRDRCRYCRMCVEECPAQALIWYGKRITPEEAFYQLEKDRQYYEESGGGITISGGEPLLQPDFTQRLLYLAKKAGIRTAVDTTCLARWNVIEEILQNTDTLLIDIKLFNGERHRQATGVDNKVILENIRKISSYVRTHGKPQIFIRTPPDTGNNGR